MWFARTRACVHVEQQQHNSFLIFYLLRLHMTAANTLDRAHEYSPPKRLVHRCDDLTTIRVPRNLFRVGTLWRTL